MNDLTGVRRLRPAVIAAGVLLPATAVVAGLLLLPHLGSGHPNSTSTKPNPTTESAPVPSGPLTLLTGSGQSDGVEVGFPHSTLGAVSAAANDLGAIASALDPDYAASLGRTVADPANTNLPSNLATSTIRLRAALQLPTSGPLAAPVAFLTTPQMYQLRAVTEDRALVLLLTTNTFINAQGGTAQTVGVYPMHMHWADGDWRVAGIGAADEDYSGLSATPGSASASANGWQPLHATDGAS